MDGDKVRQIEGIQAQVNSLNPRKEAGEESVGMADRIRQWLPSVFVYLLWVAIFAIAQMLLNSVIEEKSNRIIEVLLSSVTPGELMTGKLAGIAATGLTMLAIWIGSATAIGYCFSGGEASGGGEMASLPSDIASILSTTWLLPAFFVYFVLGYLVYATFFLALGSTCNTLKEAQNLMAMVIPILIIPLMTMPFIPRDPNGTLATVLSWIPPFTPFVMMNRVTGHPPLFDVIGTMVMLVLFVSFELWAAAKIFRIGILRTGQPPKFFEILRWFSDHS
jgi:ABC-2 type transport system permease protein